MEHDFLAVSVLCEQSAVTQVWHLLDVPENPSVTSLKVYVDFLAVSVLSEQSAVTPI